MTKKHVGEFLMKHHYKYDAQWKLAKLLMDTFGLSCKKAAKFVKEWSVCKL